MKIAVTVNYVPCLHDAILKDPRDMVIIEKGWVFYTCEIYYTMSLVISSMNSVHFGVFIQLRACCS